MTPTRKSAGGRWVLRTTDTPGEIEVDGPMAGDAAPMPFPVPVREDRITDADMEAAGVVLRRYGISDRIAHFAVCVALLKGGVRL